MPSGARGGLGVVVVSYNTRDLLDTCLSHLQRALPSRGADVECWVVDNASADGSAAMVRTRHPWARVVETGSNLGYAAAANLALRAFAAPTPAAPTPGGGAGRDWAAVLNPDVELEQGALTALIQALESRPEAAIAGPRLAYPDGRFQHAAFRFPGLAQILLDVFPVRRLADGRLDGRYARSAYRSGRPFAVDFPLGACMVVRVAAMRVVGVMDESYFMYCEEMDWCRRFRAAGHIALCVPAARAVHHAGASTSRHASEMFVWLWRSRLRYFKTHETPARARVLVAAARLALGARALVDRLETRAGRLSRAARDERIARYRAVFAPDWRAETRTGP